MRTVDEQRMSGRRQVSLRKRSGVRMAVGTALSLASLMCVLPGAFAQKLATPSLSGVRQTANGEVVVNMVFPVLGGAKWVDTYGKPRLGVIPKQHGQDLPATRMRPLLACFNGVWTGQGIRADNGCYATYGNINNKGYAYAPGVWPGVRVRAGQHIAYCGTSTSAEGGQPQLHFELSVPGHGVVNPAASLRVAKVLQQPLYPVARPEVKPANGQLRLDGEVVSVDIPRGVAMVRVAAWIKGTNKVTAQTQPTERWVRISNDALRDQLRQVEQGDLVAVVGKDPGRGKAIVAKQIMPLKLNEAARLARASVAEVAEASASGSISKTVQTPVSLTSEVEPISEEPEVAPPPVPEMPRVMVLADFESGYYQGWEILGNCWGRTPETTTIASSAIRGWGGLYFMTTARAMPGSKNITSGTGRARSATFVIPEDASEIRFRIAGGNYPYRCCINLLEDESVLRTATGENPFKMSTVIWDVSELRGKTVRLEIRDSLTVGIHAYVHVDDIVLLMGSTELLSKDIPYPKANPNPNPANGGTPLPPNAPLPRTAPFPPPGVFNGGGGIVPDYGGG